ncbi:MAG: MFS transporter [Gemmatimonas sp.]
MSGGPFASVLAVMRVSGYRAYTVGSTISLVGTWVQRVAQGWLVWQLTESPAWLGAISFATLGSLMVMSPITGVLADRMDRLTMSRLAQSMMLIQSVILATLVWFGWATPWLVLALAFYLGIGHAFHTSARLSLVPNLVPAELMAPAIAVNSVIYQLATFIGPALAGIIIVRFGVGFAFAVNIGTFAAFLAMLARVTLARHEPPAPRTPFVTAIGEGFRYAAVHTGIRPLLIALLVSTFTIRAVPDLLPAFSAQVFARGAEGLAWLTSMIGFGAMLGGLWMAQRGHLAGFTRVVIAQMAAATVAMLLFVATDWFPFAVVALTATGFAMIINSTGTQTLIQSAVVGHMRGRVLSVFNLILQGSPALGALAIGGISEAIGLRWPVAAGSALCLVAWAWIFPQRRTIAKAMEQPANR